MTTAVNKSNVEYFRLNSFSYETNAILNSQDGKQIPNNNLIFLNDLEKLVSKTTEVYQPKSINEPKDKLFQKPMERVLQYPITESNFKENLHVSDENQNTNQIWNRVQNRNNSCSKANVTNDNMAYDNASSIESIATGHVPHVIQQSIKPRNAESAIVQSELSLHPKQQPVTANEMEINQVKTFKNGKATGHSRLWNSCGSAGSFLLDIRDISDVLMASAKIDTARTVATTTTDNHQSSDLRHDQGYHRDEKRDDSQLLMSNLKRSSQASYEAEFDPDGRIHEQINVEIHKCDPFIIAGQITLSELAYFKRIKAEEFLSFKWTGLSKHVHAPAIVASTRWFNQLNFWAQRFVLECNDLSRRSEMLSYLIRIVKKLVDNFNNLSSAMALMSALQVECIYRLKQTWSHISHKDRSTFRRMEELFSSDNNYDRLRSHIDSLKLPCIPYLGLYLTDLTYINIAHAKQSEFESQTKTDQINNILRKISEFQQSSYNLSRNSIVFRYFDSQRYIEELQKIIEDTNYRTSVLLEPPPLESTMNTITTTFTANSSVAANTTVIKNNNNHNQSTMTIGTSAMTGTTKLFQQSEILDIHNLNNEMGKSSKAPILVCSTPKKSLIPLSMATGNDEKKPTLKTIGIVDNNGDVSTNGHLQSPISPQLLSLTFLPPQPAEPAMVPKSINDSVAPEIVKTATKQNPDVHQINNKPDHDLHPGEVDCGSGKLARTTGTAHIIVNETENIQCGVTMKKFDSEEAEPKPDTIPKEQNKMSIRNSIRRSFFWKRSQSKRASSVSKSKLEKSKQSTDQRYSKETKPPMVHAPFLSLLDDSFLDVNLTDNNIVTSSGSVSKAFNENHFFADQTRHANLDDDNNELLCAPPICKCKIKGGIVNVKPKSAINRKTEMVNLIKIAHVANLAAKFSSNEIIDSQSHNTSAEKMLRTASDPDESIRLVCQGILLRKKCLKNHKRPLFSSWNRYWCVLLVSKMNAYFVYFENCNFRATDRNEFKHKKCHVQDLKHVRLSLNWPTSSSTSPQQPMSTSAISQTTRPQSKSVNVPTQTGKGSNSQKGFFLIDETYGTVHKFHEFQPVKSHQTSGLTTSPPASILLDSVPSGISDWYQSLLQCIGKVEVNDHHHGDMCRVQEVYKDLIVLHDSNG